MDSVTKVLLSITTIALVAVIVVNYKGSVGLTQAVFTGFGNSLGTAEKG
jgi:hypothetical protein